MRVLVSVVKCGRQLAAFAVSDRPPRILPQIANLSLIQQGRANEIEGERMRQNAARSVTPRTPSRPAPAAPASLPARAGSPSAALVQQLRSASPSQPFMRSSSPSMQPHLPPSPPVKGSTGGSPTRGSAEVAQDSDSARIAGILQSAEAHLRVLSPARPASTLVGSPPRTPPSHRAAPPKPAPSRAATGSSPAPAAGGSPTLTSAQRVAQLDDIISRLQSSTASLGSV